MKPEIKAAILCLPLILQGCATATKSSLLGAVIGGTAGAVLGHQSSNSSEGSVNGALIGAGLGSLIAYLSYKERPKLDATNKDLENAFPSLTEPKLRSIYVPDKIEGNRYIKGHQIYIIEDSGTWKKE